MTANRWPVVIIAGGLGTRLRPKFPDLPKALAPVGGKAFIDILLDSWIERDVSQFVLSLGFRSNQVISHLGSRYKNHELSYAVERKRLGTAGGLLNALLKMERQGLVWVTNGDTLVRFDHNVVIERVKKAPASLTMLATPSNRPGEGHVITADSEGCLSGFIGPEIDHDERNVLLNSGVLVLNLNLFPLTDAVQQFVSGDEVSIEKDLIPWLMSRGEKVPLIELDGSFVDIGTPASHGEFTHEHAEG